MMFVEEGKRRSIVLKKDEDKIWEIREMMFWWGRNERKGEEIIELKKWSVENGENILVEG